MDDNYMTDSVKRFVYGNSRQKTLEKIEKLIMLAIKLGKIFKDRLLYGTKNDIINDLSEDECEYRLHLKEWSKKGLELNLTGPSFINILIELLNDSINGIKELKKTYINGVTYVSELDVLIELIERTTLDLTNN